MTLYWTPPAEANGILLGYVVQHQQGNRGYRGDAEQRVLLRDTQRTLP